MQEAIVYLCIGLAKALVSHGAKKDKETEALLKALQAYVQKHGE
jgi:hypothetical protein